MTDSSTPCRIVVLLSGNGSNLQAIINHFQESTSVTIAAVLSNRADAQGLNRARAAGIPTRVVAKADHVTREDFDTALATEIEHFQPDFIALAGFMRILTPAFVDRYEGRLLNIHPSLLPRYRGLDTHQRALDAGDPEHGATVHFVTAELDGGPSILQARVPIEPGDSPEALAARVLEREHQIYPMAIQWLCEGRLRWRDHMAWLDGEPLSTAVVVQA
ncbi:phosphoribosylglycinamide formyltransferase [Hydrocarboniclastica marina]|uniref:Phosphoribosylglycinamide formyltransferase n=1 Tax=Hydrocarboniclastica marina TaxID=2259620 RepID=A0A4P7XI18_9ALTE|nr:phosphoribosylglycinamide formyltransferase [Hydrocarboniclastica marina]QCF26355.1 phosphoribosylglycinamide formyltransferase [Hydrocarboniclastica marina]